MPAPVNVLVIFCSHTESTEQLALAVAVGAVQARANIRIRRLPAHNEESVPGTEPLTRMQREYVPPASADALWADAVIISMNDRISGLSIGRSEAVAYGRRVASDIRSFKNPPLERTF
jgi:NAD(P)H dehydrogenase (quinone)